MSADVKPTPTPKSAYEDVWKPIIEDDEGNVDMETVKSLLFDYGAMLHANSILFPYLTEGRITHPQHDVIDVIHESDQSVANTVDEGIQTILGHLLTVLETVEDESADVQLKTVVDQINSLYERPQAHD